MPHSRLATPSATIAILKSHSLYTRSSLGQHFLVDDNVVGRILGLAALTGRERVLEIGPGIGTLTVALCSAAASVVAVERDERLLGVLGEVAAECGNLTIVRDDAVSVPVEALAGPSGPPEALVANLPYGVAATVVLRFFEELPSLRSATVMVQAEVADRMSAEPGTKAYGAYTVKLRLRALPAGRFSVPRACFLPPPRVDSAVVRLERADRPEPRELLDRAGRVANAAFSQRRKTLANALRSGLGATDAEIARALEIAGIDGSERAERLTVDDYIRLARSLRC